ncbi:MAG: hypothetical protein PHX99_06470 [Synergistaceae bacterium]|nr:hypothetical protein [Synergistaceae bacterium]
MFVKFIKNSFFKLFIKNEYMLDCLNANKIYYFELLLREKGFLLENFNEENIIENVDLDIDINDNINKKLYDEYSKSTDKNIVKFENLNKRINFLNLTADKLDLYKEIIYDDHKFEEHINIIRFLKSDKYIDTKLNELKQNSFTMKYMTDPYKKIFRISKSKPKNYYELIIMIVGMIKHITCPNMIISTQKKIKNKYYNMYNFDIEYIKFHLILNLYSNCDHNYFYHSIIKMCNIYYDIFID